MPLVKAPNGAEMELDEHVASGLVNSKNAGWSYVEKSSKPADKK